MRQRIEDGTNFLESSEQGDAVVGREAAEDLFHDVAKLGASLFEGFLAAGSEGEGRLAAVFEGFFAMDEAGVDEMIDDAGDTSRIEVAITSDQGGEGLAAGDSGEDAEVGE